MRSILAALLVSQASVDPAAQVQRWQTDGERQVEARAVSLEETKRARNVILFLADGVGPTFHTAARIHAIQARHAGTADGSLSFEDFPHAAFARTSAVDDYVTDSAASATALLAGIKTVNGGVAVPAGFGPEHCGDPAALPATLGEIASASGRATGIVTTSYLVDASPAAFYAHTPVRGWVVDDRVPEAHRQSGCRGVVEQLVRSGIDVALGGGRIVFAGKTWRDPESDDHGLRTDNRNLMEDWAKLPNARVVHDRSGLLSVKAEGVERLLGLFAPRALFDEEDRSDNPTLAEMTVAALEVLQRDPDGYVLVVEEEGTDEHQHAGRLGAAFESYLAFDTAVVAALARVDLHETLVIVTSDHGQPLAMAGPAAEGKPILGLAMRHSEDGTAPEMSEDGKSFPVMGFYVGPQPDAQAPSGPVSANSSDANFVRPSAVKMNYVPHSGVDVGVFAAGPGSELISGVMDQHAIFHAIHRAMDRERID